MGCGSHKPSSPNDAFLSGITIRACVGGVGFRGGSYGLERWHLGKLGWGLSETNVDVADGYRRPDHPLRFAARAKRLS